MLSPKERAKWQRIGRLIAEDDLRRLGIDLTKTRSKSKRKPTPRSTPKSRPKRK